jgi:hypothetical protein
MLTRASIRHGMPASTDLCTPRSLSRQGCCCPKKRLWQQSYDMAPHQSRPPSPLQLCQQCPPHRPPVNTTATPHTRTTTVGTITTSTTITKAVHRRRSSYSRQNTAPHHTCPLCCPWVSLLASPPRPLLSVSAWVSSYELLNFAGR